MQNEPAIIASLRIKTREGDFLARYSAAGLARLNFPSAKSKAAESTTAAQPVARWHQLTTRAIRRLLQGRSMGAIPPLDLSQGTEFQKKAWVAMRGIPAGKTATYGELAISIRKPNAVRAVGGACGANPVPLIIPCHRVVAAQGGLGGFSSGLHWKIKLLGIEKSWRRLSPIVRRRGQN